MSVSKKEQLLKLVDEIQHITTSLKEVIAAMSPDEKAKLAERLQKGH